MAIDIKKPTVPSGAISFSKGDRINFDKTPQLMRLVMSWVTGTDYDAGAEVLYREGGQVKHASVAMFGTHGDSDNYPTVQSVLNGAVRHLGDVGQGSDRHSTNKQEIIEIRVTPDLLAVVPWCYSAQSNGTGSFHRYQVALVVEAGEDTIAISADDANDDKHVYTVVPALIHNNGGQVSVNGVLEYSKRNSEQRPRVNEDGTFSMDDSSRKNMYK